MVRLSLLVLTGVLALGVGQRVLAVDGPPADPVAPDRTVVVEPAVPVETVPPDRAVVRADRVVVRHTGEVSKLPGGSVAAVEQAVPGGTIVDVEKVAMKDAWDVDVVDQNGRVHSVRVDKGGQVVTHREVRRESDRLAKLPEAVKSSVRQRYPDAVMYNTEVTVEDGKKVHEVEILSQGRRIDVKVRPSGEILEVETDKDDVGHDPKP